MTKYNIDSISISSSNVQILNNLEPGKSISISYRLGTEVKKIKGHQFVNLLTLEVCKSDELEKNEKTFYVRHTLRSLFVCDNASKVTKALEQQVAVVLYPELRTKTSSMLSLANIANVPLPLSL